MSETQQQFSPLATAGALAFSFFIVLRTTIRQACANANGDGFDVDFNSTYTSAIMASFVFLSIFTIKKFATKSDIDSRIDKFGKISTIVATALIIIWASYLLVDDGICYKYSWRKYGAMLGAPALIIALAVTARKWLRSDD